MNTSYRYDYEVITEWISPGEKVLDLGCGDGSLLKHLMERARSRATGWRTTPTIW
jgi:cyclopropane fatty-acyl-phospholipid synthase-like methyltransferase